MIQQWSNLKPQDTTKGPNKKPSEEKLYPLDAKELKELKTQIEKFLDSNHITPFSSLYGGSIVFTKKKDGRLCMCIDYR